MMDYVGRDQRPSITAMHSYQTATIILDQVCNEIDCSIVLEEGSRMY